MRLPFRLFALTVVVAALGFAGPLRAHDLPADVVVQIFVKPEGRHLHVLVRAPLRAMADVDYPTKGPEGLLDLARADRALHDAATMWVVPGLAVFEDGTRLSRPQVAAVRVSLPSNRAFLTYDDALAHLAGPGLDSGVQVYWDQSLLDARLDFDIQSDRSTFAIEPALARLGVHVLTAVRFLPPGGAIRAFEWSGDPGVVRLDPRWWQAAGRFVWLGFTHILGGADHLLFLVCLIVPLRRLRALLPVVTAFAVAHSITLLASAFDLAPSALWFPPLIEVLIALSIVYMALENMLAAHFGHRWMVAFGFGLVHGFGFSLALRESLQFAGTHLVTSLLSFNLGVEIGQILVLAVVIPPLRLLYRHMASERVATIVLSALVGHTAWHWMIDRGRTLAEFSFQWPAVDAALAAKVTGWLLLIVVCGGAVRGLAFAMGRLGLPTGGDEPTGVTPPRSRPR